MDDRAKKSPLSIWILVVGAVVLVAVAKGIEVLIGG